ncbi:MAG: diadenylate cyclase CdaA [Brevinematia bacterium]
MEKILNIEWIQLIKNILDICAVAYVFYFLYSIFENTNTISILKGFVAILIINAVSRIAELKTLEWIFQYVMNNFVLLVVVLFQPEIRKILNRIGQRGIAGIHTYLPGEIVREIVDACLEMSKSRTGALILIEQSVGLKHLLENAVILNSEVSKDALLSIFYKGNPLHDGGVVISEDKIAGARVMVPSIVSDKLNDKNLGTRHRAAMYVSDETDAIAIVVSEEKGSISIAHNGRFEFDLTEEDFIRRTNELLGIPKNFAKTKK